MQVEEALPNGGSVVYVTSATDLAAALATSSVEEITILSTLNIHTYPLIIFLNGLKLFIKPSNSFLTLKLMQTISN
jgi:hypothetical protein